MAGMAFNLLWGHTHLPVRDLWTGRKSSLSGSLCVLDTAASLCGLSMQGGHRRCNWSLFGHKSFRYPCHDGESCLLGVFGVKYGLHRKALLKLACVVNKKPGHTILSPSLAIAPIAPRSPTCSTAFQNTPGPLFFWGSPEADSKSLTFLIQGFLLGTFATTDDAPGDGFKDVLQGTADADVFARRWVGVEVTELSRGWNQSSCMTWDLKLAKGWSKDTLGKCCCRGRACLWKWMWASCAASAGRCKMQEFQIFLRELKDWQPSNRCKYNSS